MRMAGNQEFCFAPVQLEVTLTVRWDVEWTARYKTQEFRGETSTSHRHFIGQSEEISKFCRRDLFVKTQSQHLKERKEKPQEVT